jgi:hypothetical protein
MSATAAPDTTARKGYTGGRGCQTGREEEEEQIPKEFCAKA